MTQLSAIINATQHFIEYNDDPKAAIIVTLDVAIDTLARLAVVFFFYDGATPQGTVFDEFNSFIPTVDDVSTQNYSSLVSIWIFQDERVLTNCTGGEQQSIQHLW